MKILSKNEVAAEIRKELRERLGATSRQISVKGRDSGYSIAINITIKDPKISLLDVEKIAEKWEIIRRDCATDEILAGCNRWIHTKYDGSMLQDKAAQLVNKVSGLTFETPLHKNINTGVRVDSWTTTDGRSVKAWIFNEDGLVIHPSVDGEFYQSNGYNRYSITPDVQSVAAALAFYRCLYPAK